MMSDPVNAIGHRISGVNCKGTGPPEFIFYVKSKECFKDKKSPPRSQSQGSSNREFWYLENGILLLTPNYMMLLFLSFTERVPPFISASFSSL